MNLFFGKIKSFSQGRGQLFPQLALFYEFYVLDLIGHLPDDTRQNIEMFNIQPIFRTKAKDWREVIREFYHVTDKKEKNILDSWKEIQKKNQSGEIKVSPIEFARMTARSLEQKNL